MVQGPQDEMSVMRSEAMSTLRRRVAKKSWPNPFLVEEQREALNFFKKEADRMNEGVKQMTNAIAPGVEVNFHHGL